MRAGYERALLACFFVLASSTTPHAQSDTGVHRPAVAAPLRIAQAGPANPDRPWLGVQMRNVTRYDAGRLGLSSPRGAVVTGVSPGSPAALAGVQANDIIVGLDGAEIADGTDIVRKVAAAGVGSQITVRVFRAGQPRDIKITLSAIPSDDLQSLLRQASKSFEEGKYAEAEALYKRAIPIAERMLGPDHLQLAMLLSNLGAAYFRQERFQEAEPLEKRALAIREKALPPDHPDVVSSLDNLARIYEHQRNYDNAVPLLQRLLATREKVTGPDSPEVGFSLNRLVVAYSRAQRWPEAEPLAKRRLAIAEQTLPPDHPTLAIGISNLAATYHKLERYDQAEPLYQRALTIIEKVHGPNHPKSVNLMILLSRMYYAQSRTAEADILYRKALAIEEKARSGGQMTDDEADIIEWKSTR